MKQPHTESDIQHTDDEQNTGNHKSPAALAGSSAKAPGGMRVGAENVEHLPSDKPESIETGTDVDDVSGLDEVNASEKSLEECGPVESAPGRDEQGRL